MSTAQLLQAYLEEKLNALVEKSYQEGGWEDAEWTKRVKEELFELRGNYEVCASGIDKARWGEWLCDLMWLEIQEDQKDYIVKAVPLATESEWRGWDWIRDDFQKLLVLRAETRLMIFQASTADDQQKVMDKLKTQIQAFSRSLSGDRYLFACYIRREKTFTVSEFIYSP